MFPIHDESPLLPPAGPVKQSNTYDTPRLPHPVTRLQERPAPSHTPYHRAETGRADRINDLHHPRWPLLRRGGWTYWVGGAA